MPEVINHSNRAPTENNLRSTKDALDALVDIIQQLEWESPNGTQSAFGRVELFDDLDLGSAFKRLLLAESRICLVIYSTDQFENQRADRQVLIRRKQQVYLIFTDRVIGKRTDALLGTAGNPGLLALRDLILPAVAGLLLPQPKGIVCLPVNGSLLQVEDTDKKSPGRMAYLLEIELQGGWIKVDVGRSPIW